MTVRQFVSDIAFTPAVKAQQARLGSRASYAKAEGKRGWRQNIDDDLAAFIAARDSLYLATTSAEGQPYIQHRGGPAGFLKMLGPRTLGFADFSGNRQYITLGNLTDNPRAFIFLMDYAQRQRIKLWGRARFVEGDPALMSRLIPPGYVARPERAIVFEIETWDINCKQHIVPRFAEADIAPAFAKLQARIVELEEENARLRVAAAAPA